VTEDQHPFKYGKTEATHDPRTLAFVDFVEPVAGAQLKLASPGFGIARLRLFNDWGMLGNDKYGDCGWAGACHEHELWTMLGGNPATFTEADALEAYSECTGFNPNDPSTDKGTDMRLEMNFRRNTGIQDSTGKTHKIGGYCALEPGNWTQLLQALYVGDAVAIGTAVPRSAEEQFANGRKWSVVSNSPIMGYHYVPCVARPGQLSVDVITWGKVQGVTQGFYTKYSDEAYMMFSEETMINGKSPEGFDLAQFAEALKEI